MPTQTADVVIAGATYLGVPSVELPTVGGGTALFSLGGGKTIQSISPTNIPVEWSSVVATYELVCRDFDVASGSGSKITRSYAIPFTNAQNSLNPDDYGFSSVMPRRYSEWMDSTGPFVTAKAPSGEFKSTSSITPTTTQGTASGDDDNAWAAAISKHTTPTRICYPDNSIWSTDEITSPTNANARKLTLNSDGTYDVEFTDDTTATSGTYSGSVVSTAYGNECIISCECTGVTGTASAYAPAYLVTYSDNSTETILAASGDVANGSY